MITIEMTKEEFLEEVKENVDLTMKNIGVRSEKAPLIVEKIMGEIRKLDFSNPDMLSMKYGFEEALDSEFGEKSIYIADELVCLVETITDMLTHTSDALGLGEEIEFEG